MTTTVPIVSDDPTLTVTVNGTKVWPIPQPAPAPAPAPVPFGDRLGFSPGAQYVTGGHDQAADIAVVRKAGARWLRVDVFDDNGNATVDAGVKAAVAAGLKVLVIVNGNFKAGPAAYAAACTTVVKRYAPMGVHTFELVNEPNGTSGIPLAAYLALLPAGIASVRIADPTAKILAGALAPSREPTDLPAGPGFTAYGKAIIDSGAKYDVLSVHPYSFPNLPVSQPDPTWQSWTKMLGLHTYAVGKGDPRPIWATEYGAPTVPAGGNGYTDAQSVTAFNEVVAFMKANPWLERLFWFDIRDSTSDGLFGVIRANGTEKPVLAAMTAATG